MENAEMCHHWKCRREAELCMWRNAYRKNWVGAEMYIRRSSAVLRSMAHSDSSVSERRTNWKKEAKQDLSSGRTLISAHWFCATFQISAHHLPKSTGPASLTEKNWRRSDCLIFSRASLSSPQLLLFITVRLLFIMATSMETLPAHLLPLVMEEFPHSLVTACICRAGLREPRLRCVQCGIIEEEEEDECSTLEEDQALRSFLHTVETLKRSTRWAPPCDVLPGLWYVHTVNRGQTTSTVCQMEKVLTWNLCGRWSVDVMKYVMIHEVQT